MHVYTQAYMCFHLHSVNAHLTWFSVQQALNGLLCKGHLAGVISEQHRG